MLLSARVHTLNIAEDLLPILTHTDKEEMASMVMENTTQIRIWVLVNYLEYPP